MEYRLETDETALLPFFNPYFKIKIHTFCASQTERSILTACKYKYIHIFVNIARILKKIRLPKVNYFENTDVLVPLPFSAV